MRAHLLPSLALTATLLAGCAGATQTAGTPSGGTMPQTVAFDEHLQPDATNFTVGIRLTNELPGESKPYGKVLAYFKGTTSKKSKVITIPLGSTVVFQNVDSQLPHTGSLLGDAGKKSAPWPSSFDGSETAAKAGSDISSTNFSTGVLSPGTSSLQYTANVPGFYMFGCFFHYDSAGMRDVIIVK
jgi:plastocyanin